jgi:hypothetical protein
MAYYNEYDQLVETDEERRKREEEAAKKAGETPVVTQEKTVYADGSQTHTTTQEVPAPGLGDRIGAAVNQFGTNFSRRLDNLANAPGRVMQGMQNVPGQMQQRFAPGPVAPANDYTAERNDQAAVDAQYAQQPQAPAAPVAPQAPAAQPAFNQQQYNARIGAQESGNRADIGYHDRTKSTAAGQYGLTAGAYQDARRSDPSLPEDITQATPEQQTQAMNIFTQKNAQYLQSYGIAPTENTLAAAHFLGAKGLANYLRDGTISPAAAAANGGEENVRRIVNARLGGQAAAASGATGRPTAVPGEGVAVATGSGVQGTMSMNAPTEPVSPYSLATGVNPMGLGTQTQRMAPQPVDTTSAAISRYQTIQNDPNELMKFAFDSNTPDYLKQRAKDQLVEQYDQQKKQAEAEKLVPTMNQTDIARLLTKKSEGNSVGDWAQYILYKYVGLKDLANQKAEQLGIGHQWASAMDADGNTGMIQYTASGKPIAGIKSDGSEMDKTELAAYATQGAGKTSDVSLTMHQALVDGKLHTFESKRTPAGLMYRDATANGKWQRQAPEGMTNIGQQDPAHVKGLTAANSVVTRMSKANADAIAATGRPQFSQEQIQQARDQAYSNVTGKPFAGTAMAAGMPATEAAAPTTTAPAGAAPAVAGKAPKSMAQQILDYEAPPPVGPTTGTKVAIMNEVNRLAAEQGKTFDAGKYKVLNKTRQDFTTGPQGKVVTSMNTAVAHLDTLDDAGQALHGGQIPLSNKIVREFATQMGLPEYTNFESIKHIVGSEIAKAVAGSGGSALADRQAIEKEFDSANSPDQLQGVIGKYKELMAGQLKSQKQTFVSSGLPESEFDNKLLPRTKKVINGTEPPTRSKW